MTRTIKLNDTTIIARPTITTHSYCVKMGWKDKYIGNGVIVGTNQMVKVYEAEYDFYYREA